MPALVLPSRSLSQARRFDRYDTGVLPTWLLIIRARVNVAVDFILNGQESLGALVPVATLAFEQNGKLITADCEGIKIKSAEITPNKALRITCAPVEVERQCCLVSSRLYDTNINLPIVTQEYHGGMSLNKGDTINLMYAIHFQERIV